MFSKKKKTAAPAATETTITEATTTAAAPLTWAERTRSILEAAQAEADREREEYRTGQLLEAIERALPRVRNEVREGAWVYLHTGLNAEVTEVEATGVRGLVTREWGPAQCIEVTGTAVVEGHHVRWKAFGVENVARPLTPGAFVDVRLY